MLFVDSFPACRFGGECAEIWSIIYLITWYMILNIYIKTLYLSWQTKKRRNCSRNIHGITKWDNLFVTYLKCLLNLKSIFPYFKIIFLWKQIKNYVEIFNYRYFSFPFSNCITNLTDVIDTCIILFTNTKSLM